MRYALIIAIMLSLSSGLVYESFRYQSTAGLFEDDYDLLFDPARICEIQGSRLWTSLSNFVSGNENLFSNGSLPYILVGGTTNFGKFYPGMVYDHSVDKTALATGLFDPNGNQIYGDGELTTIDWDDTDNNGIFDRRTIETETRSAYEQIKDNNMFIGLGYKLENLRLGLGYLRVNSKYISTDPDNNFTYDYTIEDLTTNSFTLINRAKFSGDENNNYGENDILFSIWKDMEKLSIGLLAGFGFLGYGYNANIAGDSAIYTQPADTNTFYTRANILDSSNQKQSGNIITVNLRAFYNYNENIQGRYYLGFFTQSLGYGDDAIDHYYKTRDNIMAQFTWDTINTFTYYNGSSNIKGFQIGTKHLFKISEKLRIGFGAMFINNSVFDSTLAKDTTVSVRVYDDNDGISFDPDDYMTTVWSSETWMTKVTGVSRTIELPVGVEFNLFPQLTFRLGARHTYTMDDITTVTELVQYEPQRTRTVDGTGAVTEDLIDPNPAPIGSDETQKVNTPNTDYFYGIGWNVTDNLQIDIMGFSELTNLENWRISATLKF
ncbi:MAG: hypothetical protein ABIL07_01465 [candidate division WOR-3 bacterium]